MELFQRIDEIIKKKGSSRKAVAVELNIPQSTFTRYFCVSQQDKLASLLWKLSELWPDVPRDWLFFGEGDEPKISPQPPIDAMEELARAKEEVKRLSEILAKERQELEEERRLNRQLTARLLVDGVGDKHGLPGIGKAADGQE
ncbi:hypothetical protein [Bilophila wadsworthia]